MTVAVAHDDSRSGRAALARAAREAIFLGADLAVLHVLDDRQEATDTVRAALVVQVQEVLNDAAAPVVWELHLAPYDHHTGTSLVDLTAEIGADLLVIGARRRTPIGKFLLGSTVQRVVLDSPVAVLVVKADAD